MIDGGARGAGDGVGDGVGGRAADGLQRYSRERALLGLLILSGLFVGALVVCNLVATKFTTFFIGAGSLGKTFMFSVGVLPYPLTFLLTDVISEIYGRRRANQVVLTGLLASLLVMLVLWIVVPMSAIPNSGVTDEQFHAVFGKGGRVITASMLAYLLAQLLDVHIFHFWKRVTKGRHLWFRNNASTIVSQLLDTTLVVTVLFVDWGTLEPTAGWSWPAIRQAILDGWILKMLFALADTPFCYLAVYGYRRWLRLDGGAGVEAEL